MKENRFILRTILQIDNDGVTDFADEVCETQQIAPSLDDARSQIVSTRFHLATTLESYDPESREEKVRSEPFLMPSFLLRPRLSIQFVAE